MQPVVVDVNLGGACADVAAAVTFFAHCLLAVGLVASVCGCRWGQVRVVVRRPARLPAFLRAGSDDDEA